MVGFPSGFCRNPGLWHPLLHQSLASPSVGGSYPIPTGHWACRDSTKLPLARTLCVSLALDAFTASGCGLSPIVYGLGQAAYK